MYAVQVIIGLALTTCLGFASRDYTFDGSAFYVLFQKNCGFSFCA